MIFLLGMALTAVGVGRTYRATDEGQFGMGLAAVVIGTTLMIVGQFL